MVGGMEVRSNKFVEQWAANRENLEVAFRFNRRTVPICLTFGVFVPLLTYYGIVAEFTSFGPVVLTFPGAKQTSQGVPFLWWLWFCLANCKTQNKSYKEFIDSVQKKQDKLEGRSRRFLGD